MSEEPEKSGLDKVIDEVLEEMLGRGSETEEYAQMVNQLVKLHALKQEEKPKRLTPDTMAIVLGNLLGIIIIVKYERIDIITSKAMNFVLKLR
jgi:hypothetical protein